MNLENFAKMRGLEAVDSSENADFLMDCLKVNPKEDQGRTADEAFAVRLPS